VFIYNVVHASARAGVVPGRAPRRCGNSRGGAWANCAVEGGITPAIAAEGGSKGGRSIGHVVKIFAGDGGKGGTGLSGPEFSLAQSLGPEEHTKSSYQSMVALSIISSMEASARRFFC
jgi:hypothetical protein